MSLRSFCTNDDVYFSDLSVFALVDLQDTGEGPIEPDCMTLLQYYDVTFIDVRLWVQPFLTGLQVVKILLLPPYPKLVGEVLYLTPSLSPKQILLDKFSRGRP